MTNIFRVEALRQLHAAGFSRAAPNEKGTAIIADPSLPGVLMYQSIIKGSKPLIQKEVDLERKIEPLRKIAAEAQHLWTHGHQFSSQLGLDSSWRQLSQYNNIILAAQNRGEEGLRYIVASYTADHTQLIPGQSATDFVEAKQLFAARAGVRNSQDTIKVSDAPLVLFALEEIRQNSTLPDDYNWQIDDICRGLESLAPTVRLEADTLREESLAQPAMDDMLQ